MLTGSLPKYLPTGRHIGQSGDEITALSLQEKYSDCSRVAQHALVLRSSDHVKPDPPVPAQLAQFTNTAFQPDSSKIYAEPKSTCLAPRASAIKEQGFSEAVAA